ATAPLLRDAFKQKAEFFFQVCLQDVQTFSTCTLTRPIVLLLTHAYIPAYFQQHIAATEPPSAPHYSFGRPRKFTPQFYELYWLREKLHKVSSSVQALGRR